LTLRVNSAYNQTIMIRVRTASRKPVTCSLCLLVMCAWGCGSTVNSAPPSGTASGQAARNGDAGQIELVRWVPEDRLKEWKFIVLHHSATSSGSVETIDEEHRQRRDRQGRPWRGIGYHFVVGNGQGMPDGEIRPTFRWTEQASGAHSGNVEFNELGVGICLIGNFEQNRPTPRQLESTRQLVAALQQRLGIADSEILRHGDIKATACPGRLFSLKSILSTTTSE
jgi:hypothetical protein